MSEDEMEKWTSLKIRVEKALVQCQLCEAELSDAVVSADERTKSASANTVHATREFTESVADMLETYLKSCN